jgi:hypothetical protein
LSRHLFIFSLILLLAGVVRSQQTELFSGGDPVFHREKSVIPFELRGHKIYVPIKLQQSGKIYRFILDTGAFSSIGENVAEELQLNRGTALDAGSEMKRAYLVKEKVSIRLGDMELENFRIISMDYSYFYQTDPELDGFLGSDFLKYFYVAIDYRTRELTLSRYPLPSVSYTQKYQVRLQTNNAASLPKLQCQVNDRWSWTGLIDSGAPFTIVFPLSLINKQDWRNSPLVESVGVVASWPNSPIQKNYLTRIESLQIGELELHNIPVIFSNTEDIIVGQELLSQFLIYLNYPENELSLYPVGKIFMKSNYFSCGLSLNKTADNRTLIGAIWKGSAAERADLSLNTEVIKINNQSAESLELSVINRILNDDRIATIELVIKEGYRERTVQLKKAPLLPENN